MKCIWVRRSYCQRRVDEVYQEGYKAGWDAACDAGGWSDLFTPREIAAHHLAEALADFGRMRATLESDMKAMDKKWGYRIHALKRPEDWEVR